jgi:hypothetical protein
LALLNHLTTPVIIFASFGFTTAAMTLFLFLVS